MTNNTANAIFRHPNEIDTRPQWDPMLAALMSGTCSNEAQLSKTLASVVSSHIVPTVKSCVGKTHPNTSKEDIEDAVYECVCRVIGGIRGAIDRKPPEPIANLSAYIGSVVRKYGVDQVREKYPERLRISNRLRYLCNHISAIQQREDMRGRPIYGLACWPQDRWNELNGPRLAELAANPNQTAGKWLPASGERDLTDPATLKALLNWIGHAVHLDSLVNAAVAIGRIAEPVAISDPIDVPELDDGSDIPQVVEWRFQLKWLWNEIQELNVSQRRALILHMRDDGQRSVVEFLPLAKVASLREVAAVLEMPVEELAGMLDKLPLGDIEIGEMLGVGRQKVINMRNDARKRLVRRSVKAEWGVEP